MAFGVEPKSSVHLTSRTSIYKMAVNTTGQLISDVVNVLYSKKPYEFSISIKLSSFALSFECLPLAYCQMKNID